MAINEDHRQADIAVELEETARSLAHSTRAVLVPSEPPQVLCRYFAGSGSRVSAS